MIAADQLPQMQRHVRDLVAQQPPEAEERGRIADDLLRLADGPIPVMPLHALGGQLFLQQITGAQATNLWRCDERTGYGGRCTGRLTGPVPKMATAQSYHFTHSHLASYI
uniref:Uncharacterized protein n=1 Tax=Anopheles coluzzii TaxID=1518534 RepID=A0A8W7P3L5_ANOCL